MVHVRQLHAQGEVVLEFSGSLDVRSADQLAAVALQQPLALRLVIDISHASHVHDAALGRLVEALPVHRRRTVRGAGDHQARLLAYLGEEVE